MRFAQSFILALGINLLRVHTAVWSYSGKRFTQTEPNRTITYFISQEKPLRSAKNRVRTILHLWLWNPTWRRKRNVFANEYIMKCSSLASISYLLLWLDRHILGVWLKPQAYSKYIRLWSFDILCKTRTVNEPTLRQICTYICFWTDSGSDSSCVGRMKRIHPLLFFSYRSCISKPVVWI